MMLKKKVCMVVSNPLTQDARVNKEALSLSKAGYGVVVYATSFSNLPTKEIVDGFLVKRMGVKEYSLFRLNMFRAPFDFFPALVRITRERADVYHAHDLDTLLVCFLASRFNRSKLVYDSHELFLEMQKSDLEGIWWKNIASKFLVSVWGVLERFCASRADYVFTVNNSVKGILSKRLNVKNIEVLMNCPPRQQVKSGHKFHELFSLPKDAKVVLYQGGIMWRRAIKQLVDAVEFFPKNIYLVFMGNGRDKKALMEYVSAKPYRTRIKFCDSAPLSDLFGYTASADLGVVPLLNVSLNNYYALPNKLFEYMAAGIPVVASNFPEIKKIVTEGRIGLCFNPKDPKDIAQSIKNILSNKAGYRKMKENATKVAREKFYWENEEVKLLNVYGFLLDFSKF